MKTNQLFHLPRFWQYARAHFSEKKRAYFWHFAVIAMLYFFILLMAKDDYKTHLQGNFYYMGLISTGFVFALRYFSDLARPESGLLALMRPASSTEKWLLAVIVTMIVYPIVYTLLFLLITYPSSIASVHAHSNALKNHNYYNYQLFIPFKHLVMDFYTGEITNALEQGFLWCFFLGANSYALTTSILFKRFPVIKSAALGFIFFFCCVSMAMIGNSEIEKIYKYWFTINDYEFNLQAFLLGIMLWFIAPTLMLIASYFAMQEREL